MKNKIKNFILFIVHLLIYFSLYFNSPKICAYLIKVSLLKNNNLNKKKVANNKIVILLYRSIGIRDMEIISKLSNKIPEILIMRRSIVKLILVFFFHNKNIFSTLRYIKPSEKEYFNQNKKNFQKKYEEFWTQLIFHLQNYYGKKKLNFVTFAYYYYVEHGLYAGCKNNKIPVKLWNKECFMSDSDVKYRVKINKYKYAFKFFHKISTYNEFMKKMLVEMSQSNKKKITVNGCPRIFDFVKKKRIQKKVNNLLFLSFNPKQGFPENSKNKNLNWNLTYKKIIKILNELAKNENINISIKRKNINAYNPNLKIDGRIKIFEGGTAEKYINEADIIIGHNSGSTIESLINGKFVMVPFFEKKTNLKKYLYRFDKSIIYTSEEKMKKDILILINKKFSFPIKNKKYQKTIQYYYGNSKKIKENCINFLNC